MKQEHLETITCSFAKQAEHFESDALQFTKEEYLQYTVAAVAPKQKDMLLEVAAGTGVCGRSFAPLVQSVVCLDATLPMLAVGKKEADNRVLDNILFMKGQAEALPFLNHSFDIVFSRLGFHHMTDVNAVFSEMVRVLKPNGKLVLIDMEAAETSLRAKEDAIEKLRDPSHVRNLSKQEMKQLFTNHSIRIQCCETTEIQQNLENWMALTKTPKDMKQEIRTQMERELEGKEKTGFFLVEKEKEIYFSQNWVFLLGIKEAY